MSRSSSPSELLYGPLQFTIFMMYCGTLQYMTIEGKEHLILCTCKEEYGLTHSKMHV